MDSSIKRIRPADYELSQIQDNLAGPLQQVLDWVAKNSSKDSGATVPVTTFDKLTVNGPTALNGKLDLAGVATLGAGLVVNGVSVLTGNLNVIGNTTLTNQSTVGTVIVPKPGGFALQVANQAGNAYVFGVDYEGYVSTEKTIFAKNFQSGAGFKTHYDMGSQWRMTATAGYQRSVTPIMRTTDNGAAWINCNHSMPFAGSIVGVDLVIDHAITLGVMVQVYRNNLTGTNAPLMDIYAVAPGNVGPSPTITFPKGQYPFNAGDIFGMGCWVAGGVTFAANFGLIVEFGA